MGWEELESLHLPNPSVDDQQLSAFSGLVQIEEGAEWEAPVLDFEKVGVALRTGYEAVNGQGLPGHHFFTGKRVSSWQVDYELLGFHCRSLRFSGVLGVSGLLNGGFVDGFVGQFSETLGHALRRFVSQGG